VLSLLRCSVTDDDQVPVADAGGEQVVVLPAPLVMIDGSKSTDDRKIVSYSWSRDRSSPAAGVSNSSLVDVRKHFIRSTLRQNPPNKAGLTRPCVRTYVRA